MTDLHGKFIVFDGPEGSGKSTQAELARRRLAEAGADVLLVRDPGTTRIGERIRGILLDPEHGEMGMRCEMLLYMAARAQMMAELILPALKAGRTVLSDRFISSTLAYQGGGDGLTAGQIRQVGDIAIGGRWPDLTVLFNISAERAMQRVQRAKDRIERRPIDYHERVLKHYLEQAEADPEHYRVIDADQPPGRVHEAVWEVISELGRRG